MRKRKHIPAFDDAKCINAVVDILKTKIKDEDSAKTLAVQLLRGAEGGLEFNISFKDWLVKLEKHLVWLDREDYVRALTRALWLAPQFAATDYGGSRQRDMAQVWTDTARGFLGEIALAKFFKEKFCIGIKLDRRRGDLAEFLPTDIAQIKLPDQEWRRPRKMVSIKTAKFNGRWLDAPGAQIEHSDIFILSRIGILRHHFLAFLKAISFLKDKLFVTARDVGELSEEEAEQLWNEIPEFELFPASIVGWLNKNELNLPIHMINAKVRGIKHRRIAVAQGVGLFTPETIRNHALICELDPQGDITRIDIEPIIEGFTGRKFLAHSGAFKNDEENWHQLISML